MRPVPHRRHHAKIASTAAQCPEQLLFVVGARGDDAPVRENDFGAEQIIEREPEAASQRSITSTERQPGHADRAARARHHREPARIGHRKNIRSARTSRNPCSAIVRAQRYIVHRGQVDHDAAAQRATGPVMTAATYRKREIAVARGSDRRLHVLRRAAVRDRARLRADRLYPDRCRGGVAVVAGPGQATGQRLVQPPESALDQICHALLRLSGQCSQVGAGYDRMPFLIPVVTSVAHASAQTRTASRSTAQVLSSD